MLITNIKFGQHKVIAKKQRVHTQLSETMLQAFSEFFTSKNYVTSQH